jgi:endo-1,4-beta-xylanase
MKANIIAPTQGAYDWSAPDALVDYAQANNLRIRGHALLWHESTPDWFLAGTPEQVKARLQTYITDVMTRYRGKIYAWDVVNEVITDDDFAEGPYRRSNWWDASGGNADYIDWAFEAARAADPDCQLFINDYATEQAGKLGRYVEVINDLTSRNIPLDGVGHQFHLNVDTLSANVLRALDRVDAQFLGLDQHVTELDISLYNDPGSCWETETNCDADYAGNVPDSITRVQAQLFRDVFNGFAARPSVTSVSTWGISDPQSWLNTLPTRRTNAPLLWDNLRLAKPALRAILDPNYVI